MSNNAMQPQLSKLAIGVRVFSTVVPPLNYKWGRVYIFFFTFAIYTLFHLSRKPISVVKSILHVNCTNTTHGIEASFSEYAEPCGWKPFDGENYGTLFGILDLVYLSSYAISMFFSGHIADKLDLRHFLFVATLLSGITTIAFGLGYFMNVHYFAFYLIIQILSGTVQAGGWPAVVACMGNWFGKSKRGLFMGIWTSHASFGNILGSLIAGAFVEAAWGWSFVVPGLMISFMSLLVYLFLIPHPSLIGIVRPSERNINDYGPLQEGTDTIEENYSTDDQVLTSSECVQLTPSSDTTKAVSFISALRVPGVIEYSLALFFAKLVSYSFLFWLPTYIRDIGHFDPSASADLSVVFDVGGIIGGVLAGYISDVSKASAITCVLMFTLSIPSLYVYSIVGFRSLAHCVGLLLPLGVFINGPYALITTAVAADLGTHPDLLANSRALATVCGIIDGTGSVGAALGPFLCGLLRPYGWSVVINIFLIALALAAILLSRRFAQEIRSCSRMSNTAQRNIVA